MFFFSSIFDFFSVFQDEASCIKYLAEKRWGDTSISCPHCENSKCYSFSDSLRYKCAACKKQFTVRTGTIFENSNVPLKKWFMAIYLSIHHKKGISSYQLAKDISVTQRTAWFMLHRIRYALGQIEEETPQPLPIPATQTVTTITEVDETYIGGKEKNKHCDKKTFKSKGRSTAVKVPVFGMLTRRSGERGNNSTVKAFVVRNSTQAEIQPIIRLHVGAGAGDAIMSDEWKAYRNLWKWYKHGIVLHKCKEYAREDENNVYGGNKIHTNGIEGFWSILKRLITGTYHNTSPWHLQKYVDECAYRFNMRKKTCRELIDDVLSRCVRLAKRKALSWKELILSYENHITYISEAV